jgi:hypothetical protein
MPGSYTRYGAPRRSRLATPSRNGFLFQAGEELIEGLPAMARRAARGEGGEESDKDRRVKEIFMKAFSR